MLKIGLTGGIGSGKTTVSDIFKQLGVAVYYADLQARILSDTDPEIKNKLSTLFGREIYGRYGLDKKRLADIIFKQKNMLTKVNSIIHPKVNEDFNRWLSEYAERKYIIHEAAILFESGMSNQFDRIITVTAPEKIRINRIIDRDGMSRSKVLKIIANQLPEDFKAQNSDFIIVNDNKTLILPQILKIHDDLTSLT